MNDLFTTQGRLGRKDYFLRSLILMAGIAILCLQLEEFDEESIDSIVISFATLFLLVLLFMQDVRRLHDMNKPGWLIIINFIPLVNLLFMLYLLVNPGTVGKNLYGEDSSQ
jgi:uncharacterized membrane protein YhaH (DUF805 family)